MCEVLHEAERGCVGAVVRGKKRVARAVVCVQQRCIEPWCSAALHAAVYRRLRLRSSKKKTLCTIGIGKIMFFQNYFG